MSSKNPKASFGLGASSAARLAVMERLAAEVVPVKISISLRPTR
jgi:hypothetical protein